MITVKKAFRFVSSLAVGMILSSVSHADIVGVQCSAQGLTPQGVQTFSSSGGLVPSPTSCSTSVASANSDLSVPTLAVSNAVGRNGGSYSIAFMWDVLTFQNVVGFPTGTLTMATDPSSTTTGDGRAFISQAVSLPSGGPVASIQVGTNPTPPILQHGCQSNLLSIEQCFTTDGTNLSLSSAIPLFDGPIQVEFVLWGCTDGPQSACGNLPSGAGGAVNYVDPITLSLPTGVTFTSESGVFMTNAANAVPEPSALLLLGTGLIGIGAMRRRFPK